MKNNNKDFDKDRNKNNIDENETLQIHEKFKKPEEKVPKLEIGTQIIVMITNHELSMEQGVILEKSHIHYKVKFTSLNPKINNATFWIPEHWAVKFQKET